MNTFEDLLFNSEIFKNIVIKQENMFTDRICNIDDSDLVDKLKRIHKARLSGIIPDFLSLDDNYDFDWEKNIELDLLEYLSDFNKYYFSEEYVNTFESKFTDNLIIPVVNNLKECIEGFTSICQDPISNPKEIVLQLYKFGDNFHNAKIKLQYIFLINKLRKFLEIVYLVYPNLLTMDIQDKLLKNIGFNEFINIFISNIKSSMRLNINNIIQNFNPEAKTINELFILLLNVDKNIKTLFWVVYFEDIKYVDSIIKNYSLPENFFSEVENKIVSSGDDISSKCDEYFEKLESIKEKFIIYVREEIKKNFNYKSLTDEELKKIIYEQVELFIINISDPDEKIIIKNSLEDCIGFILLEFGLDKAVDVITKCFKK